jgi:hypothetical protein
MLLKHNELTTLARRQASEQFHRLRNQAVRGKFWSAMLGRQRSLLNLYEVQKGFKLQARTHAGIQLVPITKIKGSEGRATDFDADFRPLNYHNKDRWVGVAVAHNNEVALPAVELVQINDTYFVRDGHHRISVAKQLGQLEIEADVTVWHGQAITDVA